MWGRNRGQGRRTLSLSQVYDRLENAKFVARTSERGRSAEKKSDEGEREGATDREPKKKDTGAERERARGRGGEKERERKGRRKISYWRTSDLGLCHKVEDLSRGPLDNGPSVTCYHVSLTRATSR